MSFSLRKMIHWSLIAIISLSPPGVSLVHSYCDLSGDTSVSVTTLGARINDSCCDRFAGTPQAMAPLPPSCCTTSVFSLAQGSSVPDHALDAATLPGASHCFVPTRTPLLLTASATPARSSFSSRTLPLLV
jgi:hypothetical protein